MTEFMRKECERRSSNELEIADRINALGAVAWTVAPKLFCKGCNMGVVA